MFGMGMTLKPENFKIAFARPGEIILAVTAQFTIMPLLAYMICLLLKLPAELAVGIILLGVLYWLHIGQSRIRFSQVFITHFYQNTLWINSNLSILIIPVNRSVARVSSISLFE